MSWNLLGPAGNMDTTWDNVNDPLWKLDIMYRGLEQAFLQWPKSEVPSEILIVHPTNRKTFTIDDYYNMLVKSDLVGGWTLPLWKIWLRQFGWWHSQYDGKIINSLVPVTTNQSYIYNYIYITIVVNGCYITILTSKSSGWWYTYHSENGCYVTIFH